MKSLTSLPLQKTRVLKVHILAAMSVLDEAFAHLKTTGDAEGAARLVAEAVVTATDSMTRYCAVVVDSPKTLYLYGPYATYAAATKAIESGFLGTREGAKGYVMPLIPAPKIKRVKKSND